MKRRRRSLIVHAGRSRCAGQKEDGFVFVLHEEESDRMKKTGILNADIAAVVARLGHLDTIIVADAGLPIPTGP